MAIHGNLLRRATVIITSQLVNWYRQVGYYDASRAQGDRCFRAKPTGR
jgi:hypothetical protein